MKLLKVKPSTTRAELKKQYKLAAQKYHPDRGGNHDDFIQLQKEYEQALIKVAKPIKKKTKKWTLTDKELNDMIREFDKLHKLYNTKEKKHKK